MAYVTDVEPGDVLRIGEGTRIVVVAKKGRFMKLRIESDYKIERQAGRVPGEIQRPDTGDVVPTTHTIPPPPTF